MCWLCSLKSQDSTIDHEVGAYARPAANAPWAPRRALLQLAAGSAAAGMFAPALAQVDVGKPSTLRTLVPAETLERSAAQQYAQLIAEARAKGALAPEDHPALRGLRAIARRLIPHALPWNPRAQHWRWEVHLIASKQINAWCMPGGKIAFYTGILEQLKLDSDEAAMVMGHEMAHALREHARERIAKTEATNLGLRLGAQLLGLGQIGDVAANLGTQLLSLKYSRDDETEADLVGLEIAARAAFKPEASVELWKKMAALKGDSEPPGFLSTHPNSPERIRQLEANVPKVRPLYEQALARG